MPQDHVVLAAQRSLEAAAKAARIEAENEEQHLQRLILEALDCQSQKIEMKMKHLERLNQV